MATVRCLHHEEDEQRNARPYRICLACNHTYNFKIRLADSMNMMLIDLGMHHRATYLAKHVDKIYKCPHCRVGDLIQP